MTDDLLPRQSNGYEQMTDAQLTEEIARLDRRKVTLENQLKGTNTALETALLIKDERS